MKLLARILPVVICLGTALPCALGSDGSGARGIAESVSAHLVPEPGIFILIAMAGFLFMIRRRS